MVTSNVLIPCWVFLKKMGKQPRFIEAHRLATYPPSRKGLHPRGTEVSVVLDLMIHDLEILLHLVGCPVVEFHAVGIAVLSPSEDIANVRLQFEKWLRCKCYGKPRLVWIA